MDWMHWAVEAGLLAAAVACFAAAARVGGGRR